MRGRPPATRARVLHYVESHPGCSIMQIVRGTGADRSHIYRILRATYGPDFRLYAALSEKITFGRPRMPLAA